MNEAEKNEFERRLVDLRKFAIKHAKATSRNAAEGHEAEKAYLKSEAELRDFVMQRPRENTEPQR